MRSFAIYMVGLLLVIAAIWVLLTMTGVSQIVPVAILAVALLVLLGLGIMRAAGHAREPIHHDEITETRQRVGDTEIRRSKLE